MVLSHSSGLRRFQFPELSVIPNDSNNSMSPYEWLKECLIPGGRYYSDSYWHDVAPGEIFSYSNLNYLILAYVLENTTKQSFNEYCKQNIFLPLEMKNTSYHLDDLDVNNIAIPYILSNENRRLFIPLQHYSTYYFPAADLRTSVEDLSHFLIAHMNDGVWNDVRILNESTVELMHTIQSPSSGSSRYCLGWIVWEMPDGEIYLGHIGAMWGYYTSMKIHESDNTAIIYFMNIFPENIRGAFSQLLIEKALIKKAEISTK